MPDFAEAVFAEEGVGGFAYSFRGPLVVEERSPFQHIQIFDTEAFGKMLVLDGLVQTTEADEFCYHEMLVHVPLLTLKAPKRVLVIGGGDGGTLLRVLEHPSVERAVMVEIDERVTAVCREHMPRIAGDVWSDPRGEVLFDDGIAFVRNSHETFDAIIVDSSDPVGPGEGLFTSAFYRDAATRLEPDGIIAIQAGSPLFFRAELRGAFTQMSSALTDVRAYLGAVPTYPGTIWSYLMGGRALDLDASAASARVAERGLVTRYWSPAIQAACFSLPAFVEDVLTGPDEPRSWNAEPVRALPRR